MSLSLSRPLALSSLILDWHDQEPHSTICQLAVIIMWVLLYLIIWAILFSCKRVIFFSSIIQDKPHRNLPIGLGKQESLGLHGFY